MAVVHTPGVEPLELSVVVVLMELVMVLLLGPINISGLGGQSAILCLKLLYCYKCHLLSVTDLPTYRATKMMPAPMMTNRG